MRHLDARFETAAGRTAAIRRERRLQIFFGDRAAVRAARQRRDDLSCARLALISRLPRRRAGAAKAGSAGKNAPAARRITNGRRFWLRTGDRHAGNSGIAAAVAIGLATQRRVEQIFDKRRRLRREVHLHQVRSGLDRHAELQQLEDFLGSILARIVTRRSAAAPRTAPRHEVRPAQRDGSDLDVVDGDVELMRLGRDALEPAACAALFGPHLEQVLAVCRKVVAQRDAAARSERQIVADAHALIAIGRHEEGFRHRNASRPCERHLTDFRRRSQISLGQHRRERQGIGVVVESVAGDVVRQHRRGVDLEPEQIANRVAVFGAVEPRQRETARVRSRERRLVELGLEIRHEAPVAAALSGRGRPAGGIAPVRTLRITCSHASASFGGARQIQRGEREPARFHFVVVAAHAVLLDSRLIGSHGISRSEPVAPKRVCDEQREGGREHGSNETGRSDPH